MFTRASRVFTSAIKILYKSSNSHTCKILEPVPTTQRRVFSMEPFSNEIDKRKDQSNENDDNDEHNLSGAIGEQYQPFRDEDIPIVFDVDEERKKMIDLEVINAVEEFRDPYEGLNMKRGVKGVYDIQDLVQLLRRDKAKEIFVASVPEEITYVDYIVIVTAKSVKHMTALANFVRKVYKVKINRKGIIPKIEGAKSHDWMALDLGNIALHIFSNKARRTYDLETLWTVGGKYDTMLNESDPQEELEAKYNKFLEELQPADS